MNVTVKNLSVTFENNFKNSIVLNVTQIKKEQDIHLNIIEASDKNRYN